MPARFEVVITRVLVNIQVVARAVAMDTQELVGLVVWFVARGNKFLVIHLVLLYSQPQLWDPPDTTDEQP